MSTERTIWKSPLRNEWWVEVPVCVLVTSAGDLRTSCHLKLSEDPTKALLMQQGLMCFKKSQGMFFLNRNVTF